MEGRKMDKWTIGLAAGAGYIAQHFKDLKKCGHRITLESSSGEKGSFHRLLKREKLVEDDARVKDEHLLCVSSTNMASTSEFDGLNGATLGDCEATSVFSTSSLLPLGFVGSYGVGMSEIRGDLLHKPSTPKVGPSYGSSRNRSSLRSRRRVIRPLSSLESCLTAQLFKEHVEMEECMSSSFVSPSMHTVRPFFVTDGSELISRASDDVLVVQNKTLKKKMQTYLEEKDVVYGVPRLPDIVFLKSKGKDGVDTGRDEGGRSSNSTTMATGKHINLLSGSSHAMVLFSIGMTFGILSSFMANGREVERLNGLLKQTKNLVQDLHDELEMKDSLIVQEITVEDEMCNDVSFEHGSFRSIFQRNLVEPTCNNNIEFVDQKENSESLSKIEAELEAELEMLELNITSSSSKGRFCNLDELEPDYVPDFAHDELRADMFARQNYANLDGSGTTPPHPANYAVCPKELSLRLHELLEFQLKYRIRELEAEIEKKETQNWKRHENHADEAVVINLAGEAVDAYNEAYGEFSKICESEEASYSGSLSENGKDFSDEEMEKMLINHIVEKARKGSAVVLNAQKVLCSMDLE